MRVRFIKIWSTIGLLLLILKLTLLEYNSVIKNNDGIVKSLDINVLFNYITFFFFIVLLISLLSLSKIRILINIALSIVSFFIFIIIGEIICLLVIRFNIVDAPAPKHELVSLKHHTLNMPRPPFWGDYSNFSGNWCLPHDSISTFTCIGDTVVFKTNQFGMRDGERTLENKSGKKRIVMIGDSFMEGHIVNDSARCSNILEKSTGLEHLNFGINGTSLINYYLIYKHLAKRFEHDAVIISVLPANDFEDYTGDKKLSLLKYPIYRPYWEGKYPNVQLKYSLANINQSIWRKDNYSNPVRIHQVVDSVYKTFEFKDKILAQVTTNSYLYSALRYVSNKLATARSSKVSSFQNEYYSNDWDAFEYSLRLLVKEVGDKPIILYTIPILRDLELYDKNKVDELSPRIVNLCKELQINYINLLPIIHKKGSEEWNKIYEPCDGHWTPYGERVVAHTLYNYPYYQNILTKSKK